MPAEVDEMLAHYSMGWLLKQMVELETNPEKWWKAGGLGFGDAAAEWVPPEGWEQLPMEGEVSDG
jgi:hypothetical protein